MRGTSTHRRTAIAQQPLPVVFGEASRWSECVQWPGKCGTSGEHGRGGTSETVEKIGSDANEFLKPQKGNCKHPAASQRLKRQS